MRHFKYLVSEFGTDKLEILKRKDAYPYEWVDLYEKFKHSSLPQKRNIGNGHISNVQYLHLQNVWKIFNFNTFKDFHDHYLKKRCIIIS